MKILIIAPKVLNPYLGPATVAHNLLRGFIKIHEELENQNIKVIFQSIGENKKEKFGESIEVNGIKLWTADIHNLFKTDKFDVVHSHDVFGLFPWLFRCKTIFTLHGIYWKEVKYRKTVIGKTRKFLWGKIFETYYSRTTRLVAISPYVIDELKAKGFNVSKAEVIENPVSDEFFNVEKKEEPIILYPATIIPRKNQLGFLKAVTTVRNELKEYKIIFTGSGDKDYELKLREFIDKNDLNNVEFLGKISYEKLLELYSKASIVALTSFQETLPMAVLEALATGTPVIASNVGGVPYSIEDGETGFIVNPNDSKDIAEKLLVLIDDENLRKRMGREAKIEAEKRWKAEIIAKKHLDLYLRVSEGG